MCRDEVKKQIDSLLKQNIIEPSISPWSFPVLVVPKRKTEHKFRMAIDYRKLNEKTIEDKYSLPNISDILDKLGKSQYHSSLDLASGYHQLEVCQEDREKTAFSTEKSHYQYKRLPFGLKSGPATFQRMMDNIFRGIQNETCFVYSDDIIIFSTSLQHVERLTEVFERLRQAKLKVQLDKCEFLRKEVSYLGRVITPEGVKPNADKIKSILQHPIAKTRKEIRRFLELVGYYRKFIKVFAKLTKNDDQVFKERCCNHT